MYVLLALIIIIVIYAKSFKGSVDAEKVDKTVPKLIVLEIVILLISLLIGC